MGSVGLGMVQPTQLTGLPSQCHIPPFGRRHKPTLGKSRIWLGLLRRWDLGLMPFGWPVGDTKQYPLKPPLVIVQGEGFEPETWRFSDHMTLAHLGMVPLRHPAPL